MGNKNRTMPVSWRGSLSRDTQLGVQYPKALVYDLRHYGYDRVGSNNPKYRTLIKQGLNATGSMTVTVLIAEDSDCNTLLSKRGSSNPLDPEYNKIYTSSIEGTHLSLNLPVPVFAHFTGVTYDNACAIAKRVVHAQLSARRRQFQGGVVAGELRKTLQMVIRPATALRRGVATAIGRAGDSVRSLRRSGASRNTIRRVLADSYLEWTFGWQPLLSDTRNGAIALARLATKDALERQQFRAYGSQETTVAPSIGNNYRTGYDQTTAVTFDRIWLRKVMAECIIYGAFRTRLQDSSYAASSASRLAELCGFTLADFIPTAWELMPWSFLVDYFTNVGDVINAFSNNVGEIGWAAEVHIQTSEEDFRSVVNSAATKVEHGALFYALSGADMRTKSSRKTVVRSPGGVDFSTTLRLNLPGGTQWLNIAALATGARPPKPFY